LQLRQIGNGGGVSATLISMLAFHVKVTRPALGFVLSGC
jgi:hypothetical protein